MKRILAWIVGLTLALSWGLTGGSALAADKTVKPSMGGRTEEELYKELIVGTMAPFSGNFFSELWGNNTADIDVRELIHGYNLVKWNQEDGGFEVNQTAVSGMVAETDAEGNKTFLISLADNLVYSDGSPITAKDYVFSLLLAASPQAAEIGGMTAQMNYIRGAAEYTSGLSEVLSGVKLLGEQNFSVTVDASYLPFFYELGLFSVHPYPISRSLPAVRWRTTARARTSATATKRRRSLFLRRSC